MAATIVKITRMLKDGIEVCSRGKYFKVKSFNNKVLVIEVLMGDMTIQELGEIVAGCFESISTFEDVRVVEFTFNTITVAVTSYKALENPEYVVNRWKKAWDYELRTEGIIN